MDKFRSERPDGKASKVTFAVARGGVPRGLVSAAVTVACLVTFLSTNSESCLAHPFHISVAEMEFNAGSGRLEVALKVHANDLEDALQPIAGRRLNLETDSIDSAVQVYLDRHFYLQPLEQFKSLNEIQVAGGSNENARGQQKLMRTKTHFVGSELESSWIWLYFELELPTKDGPGALSKTSGGASEETKESAQSPKPATAVDFARWAFVNTIFLERIANQINTVTIRTGTQRHALKMSRSSPWQEFDGGWFKPPRLDKGSTSDARASLPIKSR